LIEAPAASKLEALRHVAVNVGEVIGEAPGQLLALVPTEWNYRPYRSSAPKTL
jgi:hypothetical protein